MKWNKQQAHTQSCCSLDNKANFTATQWPPCSYQNNEKKTPYGEFNYSCQTTRNNRVDIEPLNQWAQSRCLSFELLFERSPGAGPQLLLHTRYLKPN